MAKKKKGVLRIGTSNVVVPGTKQSFPEAFQDKSRLHYYSSIFNTVEINSSFHKLPRQSTLQKWAEDVPAGFKFTLKLWKEVTHVKQLKYDLSNVERFLEAAEGIGNKKGCLLIQFPGKITLKYFNEVELILEKVDELDPEKTWRRAVEFRNNSWYVSETRELLHHFGAAMVLHNIPKSRNMDVDYKSPFHYFRFHGPTGNYRDSYAEDYLQERATEIRALLDEGKDVYAYFNNTVGEAYENAVRLYNYCETPPIS